MQDKIGDEVTIITTKIDGVVSAKDMLIRGFFAFGTKEIDRHLAFMS
ncbi:MAG: hypothetical protein NZ480_09410 [Bdellovibrionaceae bacterium]|nr:hypothetical protein [Pseudobdellovibrionaceae bacterium]MDW8190162.1 hypothetical protein [Pseudobdellovibrionaceae bacterium]